jgi:cytochrome b pre-mRNA-processing protein 3
LHFHFFIKRILLLGSDEKLFAQNLINYMFKDFDRSLREIGVGDLSVGKKVKFMVSSYYGRINIYEKSLNKKSNIVDSALKSNRYGTTNVNETDVKYMKADINNLIFFLDSLKNNEVLICFEDDINLYKGLSDE